MNLFFASCRFFVSVAKLFEHFLTLYQTDRVMLPFVAKDQEKLIHKLLKKFIKPVVLEEAEAIVFLLKIDLADKSKYVTHDKLDVGFIVEKQLDDLVRKKKISERQVLEFRMECTEFLAQTSKALLDKAPLKYRLVRCLSCLDSQVICTKPQVAMACFKCVMENFVDANRVQDSELDDNHDLFHEFVTQVKAKDTFVNFNHDDETMCLDQIIHEVLAGVDKWKKLWLVVRQLLLLSHGQAAIERGFSINRNVSVDNLSPQNFVSLRIIKDYIRSVGGLKSVEVTKWKKLARGMRMT